MLPSKSCVFTAASAVVFSVLLQSSLFAAEPANPASPSIGSYSASQEHGNVRVTLLSVSQVIQFEKATDKQANASVFNAVPIVRIVYLVEKLNSGTMEGISTGPVELAGPNGMPALTEMTFRQGDTLKKGGGSSSIHDYNPLGTDYLPPVADPKRALVGVHRVRCATIKTSQLQITLHEGFDGRREVFRFENVPVR